MYQVGRTSANGTPVAREVRALDDIQGSTVAGHNLLITIRPWPSFDFVVGLFCAKTYLACLPGAESRNAFCCACLIDHFSVLDQANVG